MIAESRDIVEKEMYNKVYNTVLQLTQSIINDNKAKYRHLGSLEVSFCLQQKPQPLTKHEEGFQQY